MPIHPDVEAFITKLIEATGRVEEPYFQVHTASRDGSSVVYRERVYCYELYHQLRKVMQGEPSPFTLMGELDKHGHAIIPGAKVPDFLLHVPGDMTGNFVVMEVKHIANNQRRKIVKDLDTLRRFLEGKAQYEVAIYLVYGNDEERIDRFRQCATQELAGLRKGVFVLLWHERVHGCARKVLCL